MHGNSSQTKSEPQVSKAQLWLATYTAVLQARCSLTDGSDTFYSYQDAIKEALDAANWAVDRVKERE